MIAGDLTIAMFRAVLTGFADPDQPELLAPYREKYSEVVGDVWQNWSSAMAQDFVTGVYAVCPISPETVEMTDAYIRAADPPAALAPPAHRGPRRRAPGVALPGPRPPGLLVRQGSI